MYIELIGLINKECEDKRKLGAEKGCNWCWKDEGWGFSFRWDGYND